MMVIVSYDVSTTTADGVYRLRKIAETCSDFGLRVQNSVFECNVDPAQWEVMKDRLLSMYNAEEDRLRFYFLGSNWKSGVVSVWVQIFFDSELSVVDLQVAVAPCTGAWIETRVR